MKTPEQDEHNQQKCKHCGRIIGCDYRGRKHECGCNQRDKRMNIKELIQHLQCFDEEHHVIVKGQNLCKEAVKSIAEVKFDGRNCVIEIESEPDDNYDIQSI